MKKNNKVNSKRIGLKYFNLMQNKFEKSQNHRKWLTSALTQTINN